MSQTRVSPSRLFTVALVGWIIGCALPYRFHWDMTLLIVASVSVITILYKNILLPRYIILFGILYCLGNIYYTYRLGLVVSQLPAPTQQTLLVTTFDNPDRFDDQLRYTVRLSNGYRAYFTVSRQRPLLLGYTYTVQGSVKPTDKPSQWRQNIIAKINQPAILDVQPARFNQWDRLILLARQYFEHTAQHYFPEPDASLFTGIVAGLRSGLPQTIMDDFSNTGLSHIIAVSGFNVTLLVSIFAKFTRQFGRLMHCLVSFGLITSFVVFAGGSASVVRAGILAALLIGAKTIGRVGSIFRLLLFAACIMTVENPLIVRYDIGFQLSFLAVVGLVCFNAPLLVLLEKLRLPKWLAESVCATMAAQLTTLPVIVFYFDRLSPYSVIANLFVEPFIPLITLTGPVFIALSILFKPVLVYMSLAIDLILKYILIIARELSQLPYANLQLHNSKVYIFLGYYIVLFVIYKLLPKEGKQH